MLDNVVVAQVGVDVDASHLGMQLPLIAGSNTEDNTTTEGKVTYDVFFRAIVPRNGKLIGLILNVEAQHDFSKPYALETRGVYYCARMISAQKNVTFTKSNYQDLQKVYSIWICTEPEEGYQNSIVSFSMQPKRIFGNAVYKRANYDLLQLVMVCLGKKQSKHELIGMLEVYLSSTLSAEEKKKLLQNEYGIAMTQEMKEESREMCNLSEGIVKPYEQKITELKGKLNTTEAKLNTAEAKLNAAEANAMRIAAEFEEYKRLHP